MSREQDYILVSYVLHNVIFVTVNQRKNYNLLASVILQINEIETGRFLLPFFSCKSLVVRRWQKKADSVVNIFELRPYAVKHFWISA
jgi:hypothetical protein